MAKRSAKRTTIKMLGEIEFVTTIAVGDHSVQQRVMIEYYADDDGGVIYPTWLLSAKNKWESLDYSIFRDPVREDGGGHLHSHVMNLIQADAARKKAANEH